MNMTAGALTTSPTSPLQRAEPKKLLQSLLSELSFETSEEDMTAATAVLLGRSKTGLRSSPSDEADEDRSYERRNSGESDDSSEGSLSMTETVWRAAIDPVSGRTYYYDSISRITQWEKPEEIRRLERHQQKQKQRELQRFFHEMENNIREALDRGELIPGVAPDETPFGGAPKEPLTPFPEQSSTRVRTISCMNEKLLAQVQTADNILVKMVDERNARTCCNEGRPPLPHRRLPSHAEKGLERAFEQSATILSSAKEGEKLRGEALLEQPLISKRSISRNKTSDKSKASRSHVRRNTGGTIYVQTTMDNPDIQATIKAVCGVYRAHIVQAAARKSQRSPVSVVAPNDTLDIFRDDYEAHLQHNSYQHPYYNRGSYLEGVVPNKVDKAAGKEPEIPSLADIELFYQDFFKRSQMEHDTIIMSLIYIERLIKSTNGGLTPAPHNWRSILFSCMVLSSKVWDDLSMYNIDFSHVSKLSGTGLCSFSLQRTNALELAVLTSLNFDVRVSASEYAKYYFLIRTMLSRSGMLVGPQLPLTKTHIRNLESKTVHYQAVVLGDENQRVRRTRSVDWATLSAAMEPEMPTRNVKDTLCLEQLVSMDR